MLNVKCTLKFRKIKMTNSILNKIGNDYKEKNVSNKGVQDIFLSVLNVFYDSTFKDFIPIKLAVNLLSIIV